ncbi:hypothetical protein IW261DRAFT_1423943 [Armillaria novae-zelandiae]|uniref:CxC1-like cysteine cluster associated with KDZ transposases domain-containing protein n=1 Tax=Armillaria novae-zelandiae TaxID=153914 RepID=A0AA39TXR2_9AGAR|nr:hypothetical protein IW261DRAFT_1423943 [Armillaria novae-zelandiae]
MAGITLPQFSPIKRKHDRKDPARLIGDPAYEYARQALLKRIRETEEHAQKHTEMADIAEDEKDGWEDEESLHLEDVPNVQPVRAASPTILDNSDNEHPNINDCPPTRKHCTQPSTGTQDLYCDWMTLLPHLVKPLASFQRGSNMYQAAGATHCSTSCSGFLKYCDIYLLEHSGTSNSAFCSALQDFYFWMLDAKGIQIHEPFCHAFGSAIKWYGCLKLALEAEVDFMLSDVHARIPDTLDIITNDVPPPSTAMAPHEGIQTTTTLACGCCSELLQQ